MKNNQLFKEDNMEWLIQKCISEKLDRNQKSRSEIN
jgi:hypothetical protein